MGKKLQKFYLFLQRENVINLLAVILVIVLCSGYLIAFFEPGTLLPVVFGGGERRKPEIGQSGKSQHNYLHSIKKIILSTRRSKPCSPVVRSLQELFRDLRLVFETLSMIQFSLSDRGAQS